MTVPTAATSSPWAATWSAVGRTRSSGCRTRESRAGTWRSPGTGRSRCSPTSDPPTAPPSTVPLSRPGSSRTATCCGSGTRPSSSTSKADDRTTAGETTRAMPELVLQLTRAGFLALLWLFMVVALRIVRADLSSASGVRTSLPIPRRGRFERNRAVRQLVVTGGALTGTRISLDGRPILIGRADDSTLVLDDDYASTRHARLSLSGEDWLLEDLGSTNGTYLDRAKVTAPIRVPPGAPIRIGKTVIELRS